MVDELLLKRAQQGDTAAFEALITPLENRVYRTCVHVMGAGEDAKDCAQDVLVKAYRTIRDFRGDCALESWLHRLCVTTCLDALRKRKTRQAESVEALGETGYDPVSSAPQPEEALEKKERMERLRRSIDSLPEEQRQAFTLVVLESMRYEDAAAVLHVAAGTVKSRVNRAREKILKEYQERMERFDAANVQQSEGRATR